MKYVGLGRQYSASWFGLRRNYYAPLRGYWEDESGRLVSTNLEGEDWQRPSQDIKIDWQAIPSGGLNESGLRRSS